MTIPHKLVDQVAAAVEARGFVNITPSVLSNGANLLIHLALYPVVARAAKLRLEEAGATLAREIRVARHLHICQVPVVQPDTTLAVPFQAGGTWVTCWEYVPPAPASPLAPDRAIGLIGDLTSAMASFPEELPVLGVWDKSYQIIQAMPAYDDPRISRALEAYRSVDERMRRFRPEELVPAHGDSHARNLLPGPDGWRWTDFEDVSRMPRYWDYASFVANLALFRGWEEPFLQAVLNRPEVAADRESFGFILRARILVSTLCNAALALEGHGDWSFAERQLELCGGFLRQVQQRI
ncbi:phosphotransferase [Paenibacillus sp. GYB004]|uniref:phosphotransferase family protein n=1 Tax=Paenibacillus sp. GYB004 TaxID=2994393 RepID=UPI002F96DC7A